MGGGQSKPEEEVVVERTDDPNLARILEANTYTVSDSAKYPFFLIQLSESKELEYEDVLVSDAVADYLRNNTVTHIIAQTHGWNTPPDKAVTVPFKQFIAGMQNDAAMPTGDDFHPIFVCFIWPALPIQLVQTDDARTKAELLYENEMRSGTGEETDISMAAMAAKKALDNEDPDDDDYKEALKTLAADAADTDDEEEPDHIVERAKANVKKNELIPRDPEDRGLIGDVLSIFKGILRPLETLAFGRLMKRGKKTGAVMGAVIAKLMSATEDRKRVCLMANSLGAHVLVGVMQSDLPYKLHTVFFVQAAIAEDVFDEDGKFASACESVAGPVLCTHSQKDNLLLNVFGPFHGTALGFVGFPKGEDQKMKSIPAVLEEGYEFVHSFWNSIDGTEYIDEGNAFAGGHGDFKEDETTSVYWCAIKTEIADEEYSR